MSAVIEELLAYVVYFIGAFIAAPLLVLSLERIA